MNYKKIAAVLLGAAMILSLFVGCGSQTVSPLVSASPDTAEETADTTETTEDSADAGSLNLAGAYASLEANTVMLTINGNDVLWDEFFYLMDYTITSLQSEVGDITDWTAEYSDGITYEQYVLDSVVEYVLEDAAIEYGAEEIGVTLTDEMEAEIQSDWESMVESYGSEEALMELLEADYCSKDIYQDYLRVLSLRQACLAELYGEDGGKLTDDEVAEYTAEDGYMMAKHILMLTTITDESGNSTAMTDEEKAEVLEKMEGLLDELNNYDGDDFDAYFEEIMNANTEDTGIASFPDGYLFQTGDMVTEFEEGTLALEIGQISDIVETDYGYHIIYRIPINYDVTPMVYSSYYTYSLRYITALMMFDSVWDVWFNSISPTYSDAYNELDLSEIFAVG